MMAAPSALAGSAGSKAGAVDPWQAVLERTQAIVSVLPPTSEIPQLSKSLTELANAGQRIVLNQEKLLPASLSSSTALVAGGGAPLQSLLFDSSKLDEKLNALAALNTSPTPAYDKHEAIIVSVIEAAMAATLAESERYLTQALEADWEACKQTFLRGPTQPALAPQVLTAATKGNAAAAALIEASTPYSARVQQPPAPGAGPGSTVPLARVGAAATPKMNVYASAVEDLISTQPSIAWAETLAESVVSVAPEQTSKELAQSWALVVSLAKSESVELSLRCRKAKLYLEEQHLALVQSRIGDNSKSVEASVKQWLQMVQSNHLAGVGRMGPALQVDDERVDGVPVWAWAYYCARCGAWDAAAEVLARNIGHGREEACVAEALRALAKEEAVSNPASQQARKLRDSATEQSSPWKLALLLIAAHDTSRSSQVLVSSIEDYLWLKISASLACSDVRERDLNLGELGTQITLQGPEHFRGDVNPMLYFRVLGSCGLVESAIDFLAGNQSINDTLADAVHFAIALAATGSLAKGVLGKTMEPYVGRFEQTPRTVLYCCLAMDQTTKELPVKIEQTLKRLLATSASSPQLLQTLAVLLGRERAERYAIQAANEAAKPEAAVRLLEWVAEARPDVYESLFKVIVGALSGLIESEQPTAQWQREAVRFGPAMNQHGSREAKALQQLLDVAAYLDQPAATAQLDRVDWLVPSCVRAVAVGQGPAKDAEGAANAFAQLHPLVSAVFPRVALKAMGDILFQLRDKRAKGDAPQVASLRQRASGLVHMCGLLRRQGYSLRADVAQALVHLESGIA